MARWGVIADVHGNAHALAETLARLDDLGTERVVCLGDVVGFNAHSDACAETLRDRGIGTIAGNHDLIAIGRLDFSRCAPRAAFALRHTRKHILPGTRAFLAGLPARHELPGGVVLAHGGIEDVQEYVRNDAALARNAARLRHLHPGARMCFFGHTHERLWAAVTPAGVVHRRIVAAGAELALTDDERRPGVVVFVNPGSVDAARRPEKRAEAAVFDTERQAVQFLSVPYDDSRAEAAAQRGGYRMGAVAKASYEAQRRLARLRARVPDLMARLRGTDRKADGHAGH